MIKTIECIAWKMFGASELAPARDTTWSLRPKYSRVERMGKRINECTKKRTEQTTNNAHG